MTPESNQIIRTPSHIQHGASFCAEQNLPFARRYPTALDVEAIIKVGQDYIHRFPPDYKHHELLSEEIKTGFSCMRLGISLSEAMRPNGSWDEEGYQGGIERIRQTASVFGRDNVVVTLHQFAIPLAMKEGIADPHNINIYKEFMKRVVVDLGGEVGNFEIFNELNVLAWGKLGRQIPNGEHVGRKPGISETHNAIERVGELYREMYDFIHKVYKQEGWGDVNVTSSIQEFMPIAQEHRITGKLGKKINDMFKRIYDYVTIGHFYNVLKKYDSICLHSYFVTPIDAFNPKSWRKLVPFPLDVWTKDYKAWARAIEKVANEHPDKPIYLTEYGFHGADRITHYIGGMLHLQELFIDRPEIAKRVKMMCVWSAVQGPEWAYVNDIEFQVHDVAQDGTILETRYSRVIKQVLTDGGISRELADQYGFGKIFDRIYAKQEQKKLQNSV